jgi:GT2 family glycosyltransferase
LTPDLSVVIPTYDRIDVLEKVLQALAGQETPGRSFEVIVVDDGSRDRTAETLRGLCPPYPFRFYSQSNTGPAGARNRGVEAASARLILFLGDDTVPEPGFLAEHLKAHQEEGDRKVAVLGYTGWPAARRVTPFLHHINEYGLQFGYELISDPESVPFNFFYTSNISLPASALREAGLFDTTFPHAAWEDIELSYRLSRLGYVIVYRPRAVVRHHHEITFASFRRRQERSGEAATIFYRKHPELAGFLGVPEALSGAREAGPATRIWARMCERWDLPGGRRAVDRVLRADYLRGLRRGLADAARG